MAKINFDSKITRIVFYLFALILTLIYGAFANSSSSVIAGWMAGIAFGIVAFFTVYIIINLRGKIW